MRTNWTSRDIIKKVWMNGKTQSIITILLQRIKMHVEYHKVFFYTKLWLFKNYLQNDKEKIMFNKLYNLTKPHESIKSP